MKKKKTQASPDENMILEQIRTRGQPIRTSAIMELIKAPSSQKKAVEKLLHNLCALHKIEKLPGGFWANPGSSQCVIGKFQALQSGGGRVRVTEPGDYPHSEIFISPFQTRGAWHNDIVRVGILSTSGGGKGKVLEIVERPAKEIPAILNSRNSRSLIFRAADARIPHQFLVRPQDMKTIRLKPGDLAALKPIKSLDARGGKSELWEAELLAELGPADRVSGQEAIVKLAQNVPGEFPELARAQAEALPPAPTSRELADRTDLRHIDFVTIDGADARDFDDAIHVEKTESGWILRVAIADVSHYVRPDSAPGSLDAEALARGNSWYFPRSVEPMLPKAISNGLCSLKPDEDRLAMLAEIVFDQEGHPLKTSFAPIAMRSRARLIYGDVAAFLAGDSKAAVPDRFRPMLAEACRLYKVLASRRKEEGMLDFVLPEASYEFDADGRLEKMGKAERNDANMLIEEFMIAANEAVAEFLQERGVPALYRDHAKPEREKLAALYSTLRATALEALPAGAQKGGEPDPAAIQRILAAAAGTPKEYIVNRLCLRAMQQARYEPQNIGHFGLGSKAYCHFTSPIRRYADLLVHRALKYALKLTPGPVPDEEDLAKIGDQLNGLERRAVECERDMAKRLACLALEGHEGETLSGTISGVTDFGLFVEFDDMPAEGLIRMEELGEDWFQVDQRTQSLVGARHGERWQLGQPVRTKVLSVDLDRQEIRLAPEKAASRTEKRKGRGDRRKKSGGAATGAAAFTRGKESRKTRKSPAKKNTGPRK